MRLNAESLFVLLPQSATTRLSLGEIAVMTASHSNRGAQFAYLIFNLTPFDERPAPQIFIISFGPSRLGRVVFASTNIAWT
ncbi:hypothetical protein CQ12_09125 [Bradyrhizobium jicamae]|uniref:Uncharacterized protein n=1 Tax=Bradyrhizobium jicamae TaxID=280332 RepID=A0A0R3KNQ0_9BRAD|nr:hypothetical protein CQ12_09125 [Bradyrhizobium jicamae]